jgi:hypothetical protein
MGRRIIIERWETCVPEAGGPNFLKSAKGGPAEAFRLIARFDTFIGQMRRCSASLTASSIAGKWKRRAHRRA